MRESVFPRTRNTDPDRTAPAVPQRCAHASRATEAGLEATGTMPTPPPAVTTGVAVGVGATTCAEAVLAGMSAHATTTYAVVRRLRPTIPLEALTKAQVPAGHAHQTGGPTRAAGTIQAVAT